MQQNTRVLKAQSQSCGNTVDYQTSSNRHRH